MVLAVLLFVLGKFLTNYRINPPSENNIVLTVLKCVFVSYEMSFFKSPFFKIFLFCSTPSRGNSAVVQRRRAIG